MRELIAEIFKRCRANCSSDLCRSLLELDHSGFRVLQIKTSDPGKKILGFDSAERKQAAFEMVASGGKELFVLHFVSLFLPLEIQFSRRIAFLYLENGKLSVRFLLSSREVFGFWFCRSIYTLVWILIQLKLRSSEVFFSLHRRR